MGNLLRLRCTFQLRQLAGITRRVSPRNPTFFLCAAWRIFFDYDFCARAGEQSEHFSLRPFIRCPECAFFPERNFRNNGHAPHSRPVHLCRCPYCGDPLSRPDTQYPQALRNFPVDISRFRKNSDNVALDALCYSQAGNGYNGENQGERYASRNFRPVTKKGRKSRHPKQKNKGCYKSGLDVHNGVSRTSNQRRKPKIRLLPQWKNPSRLTAGKKEQCQQANAVFKLNHPNLKKGSRGLPEHLEQPGQAEIRSHSFHPVGPVEARRISSARGLSLLVKLRAAQKLPDRMRVRGRAVYSLPRMR